MNILTIILSIIILILLIYIKFFTPEVSVDFALRKLKWNLICLIIFYQGNYKASDQIALIKKWMEQIEKNKIPAEQLKMFKKFVSEW